MRKGLAAFTAAIMVTATLGVSAGPAHALGDRAPIGRFESLRVDYGEAVRVTGWALDLDWLSSIKVDIYVGGVLAQSVTANGYRPDVGAAYPSVGNNHGFDTTVNIRAGQSVCIVAINFSMLPPSPGDTQLGCKSFGNATRRISADPYTTAHQKASTAEPDTFSVGDTVVAAYQVGRYESGGGADNIGVAVSGDAGVSWSQTYLPGITTVAGGPHQRVSDPAVAYDRAHNTWMIVSLPIVPGNDGDGALVSRSTDGGASWAPPVWALGNDGLRWDKTWIACDNRPGNPFYGHCYVQANAGYVYLTTSTDGGASWPPKTRPAGNPGGVGGPIVVLPNGTAVAFFIAYSPLPRSTPSPRQTAARPGAARPSWPSRTSARPHSCASCYPSRMPPSMATDGSCSFGRIAATMPTARATTL
jgi:hypothetical protein